MAAATRIIIADDHPIVRAGVRVLVESTPDLKLAGEASTGAEVLQMVAEQKPDVLVLDLWLGDDDGLETLRELRRDNDSLPILIYSMNDEKLYGPRAIQAGASGYLMKDNGLEELAVAIEKVVSGERYLSEPLTKSLIDTSLTPPRERSADGAMALQVLTDRELQVFRLIGHGKATGEIAGTLGVSPRTIGAHRENIKNKMGVDSARELSRLAVTYVEQHAI